MQKAIHTATYDQLDQVLSTTLLAFCTDPFVRWAVSDPHQYLTNYPRIFRAFIGKAIANSAAFYAEGFSGVAVWLPPGVSIDEQEIAIAIENLGSSPLQEYMIELFEGFSKYHPSEPHWYLPLMGVEPSFQRQGVGSALLKHALRLCDSDKKIAYLEASSKDNLSLYERHGFEILGSIQVGNSPSVFPMIRAPRN